MANSSYIRPGYLSARSLGVFDSSGTVSVSRQALYMIAGGPVGGAGVTAGRQSLYVIAGDPFNSVIVRAQALYAVRVP